MVTPPRDYRRFSENLWTHSQGQIQDRKSYDRAFNQYLEGDPQSRANDDLREKSWGILKRSRESGLLFTRAGGKDLKRDRQKTAKRIVRTKKQYIKEGASRVDLRGFDTKGILSGRIKGRVVPIRKTSVIVKGRRTLRYRDRKGRFAKLIT